MHPRDAYPFEEGRAEAEALAEADEVTEAEDLVDELEALVDELEAFEDVLKKSKRGQK